MAGGIMGMAEIDSSEILGMAGTVHKISDISAQLSYRAADNTSRAGTIEDSRLYRGGCKAGIAALGDSGKLYTISDESVD